MDEVDWEAARLIPVSGISGAEEQERRGSSALLAVLSSVKEFGRAIVGPKTRAARGSAREMEASSRWSRYRLHN